MLVWDGVEERFWKRLAMWKRQFISKGGRITLIWSTLSSIPIYFMFFMHMLRVVRLRLEQIQRTFFGAGEGGLDFGEESSSCKVGDCLFKLKEG